MAKVYGLLGVDPADTPTSQGFVLGSEYCDEFGTTYWYVHANGAITQYDAVGIDEDFECAALTKAIADDGWRIGFAQVAFADNDYGWVAITGSNIRCRLAASCAADVALYTTATAGVLDDATTSQTKVEGVVSVTTITAATNAEVIATWPRSATF